MKPVYSCFRSPVDDKSYAHWITNSQQKLTISCKGLIAFTSSYCLNQRRPNSCSYHVYVADINSPYSAYLLVNSDHEFSLLEWDPSGTKLLVGDVKGSITIYVSKDYLMSDWKPYFTQLFASETFIVSAWYHNGLISTINVPQQNLKLPSNHLEYSEKVQQSKFGASLRLFGSKSAEGCILISKTGLICSLTLIGDGSVDVVIESLSPLRSKVNVADICHHSDGSFIVATSAGPINSTISFYQIQLSTKSLTLDDLDSLNMEARRVQITCRQFNSFHLNIMSQIISERENSSSAFEQVSHIKFLTKDSPDDVLVEVKGQNLSLVELWELEPKKKSTIHSAILEIKKLTSPKDNATVKPEDVGSSKPVVTDENGSNIKTLNHLESSQSSNNSRQTKEWNFKGNHISDKDLVAIQTPKFKTFGNNRQLNIILLAYKDYSIHCLRKEDLLPVEDALDLSSFLVSHMKTSSPLNGSKSNDDDTSPHKMYQNKKQSKAGLVGSPQHGNNNLINSIQITDIQLTCNQTCFLVIDSMSQLHAIKLPPLISCQDDKDHETYLQYMLEYSLITGNDWCDVIFCTRKESIESICDKFQDAYERQPKFTQTRTFNRQLMIRASLFRCLNDIHAVCKSSDCHKMIMLNSIASTMKSMIKSEDQEQSPSDDLTNFLKSPQGLQANFFNCQNVISKMNDKEFYTETNLTQCLQPLSQWIVELAISLVASVAQRSNSSPRIESRAALLPLSSLVRNKDALETIRELLIIIKIWGQQSETSLPAIQSLNEQLDVIGSLFRLISIMYNQSSRLGDTFDDQFIDECQQFINGIALPDFSFHLQPSGVASPLLFSSESTTTTTSQLPPSSSSSSSLVPIASNQIVNGQQMYQAKQTQLQPQLHQGQRTHLILEFFKEPSQPALVEVAKNERSIDFSGGRKIDVVRNISLGAHPVANLRTCTRCQSVSLFKSNVTHNTSRAFEQRWIGSCVCGGSWAQSKGASVNTVGYLAWLYHHQTVQAYNMPLSHQIVR